ncbi:MAG: helix-turn-helix transcriptional regulator [Thermoflexibacter sp.]|jgi:transcriptional regulator with XRE-family HTH domain|nr:helix-turn-helix transcriptional regulator [Thermoflexibacter sp.]
MTSQTLIKFGEVVRKKRMEKNLSQEDFAELVGVHRTYVGMIERAEKNITLLNIEKIAKAFGISISELLKEI